MILENSTDAEKCGPERQSADATIRAANLKSLMFGEKSKLRTLTLAFALAAEVRATQSHADIIKCVYTEPLIETVYSTNTNTSAPTDLNFGIPKTSLCSGWI